MRPSPTKHLLTALGLAVFALFVVILRLDTSAISGERLLASVALTGSHECTDGVDNNNNGEIDFADFGCFGPNGQETNIDYGFSRFYPTDSRIYYISNSDGNDAWTGLCPTAPVVGDCGPFKTFGDKAYNAQVARAGYPDWFLWERGDTVDFDIQPPRAGGNNVNYVTLQSGRSATEPRVYGSYGTSMTRPLILDGMIYGTGNIHDIAVMGLHLRKTDHESGPDNGIHLVNGPDDVLFEDNYIQDYTVNMVVEGDTQENIVLRNNIIVDAYGYDPGGHGASRPQGIYADRTNGLLLEGNVFDHNGWRENLVGSEKTIYDQNIYLAGDNINVIVRNNISARAAATGLQLRSGGEARDNLFIDNPVHGFVAHDNAAVVKNYVIGNVLLGGDGIFVPNDRGWGFNTSWDADFIGNVAAHKTCAQGEAYGFGVGMDSGRTINASENVMYNWCGIFQTGGSGGTINITNNKLSSNIGARLVGIYSNPTPTEEFSQLTGLNFTGNEYYSNTPQSWISGYTNAEWPTLSGETNARFGPIAFPDPERTIETYMVSLGLTPTKAAFYSALREQSRFSFDPRLTANAVNNYIRTGFGMSTRASSQGDSHSGTPNIETHTITASAGAGGSITPSGAATVFSGGSQHYVIAANPGHSIASVTVDGANIGVKSSYTFTGVTANHTISVAFIVGAGVADISGLVAHYTFDGDANDGVGQNHGTVRGGTTFVPGKIGQALDFHGPCDGYCDWVLTSGPAPVSTGYTWSMWLKPRAFSGSGHGQPLLAGHGGSYSFGLNYAQGANSTMNAFQFESLVNGSNMYRGATLTSLPPNDVWSHVAGSWDGTNLRVYLNGVLHATTPSASMNPMSGGIDFGGGIGGYAYSGGIDDVLIYNRALSVSEIVALYQSASAVTAPVGPTCSSFTYSAWGACQPGSTQTRTVLASSPDSCAGGSPILSQSCTYVATPEDPSQVPAPEASSEQPGVGQSAPENPAYPQAPDPIQGDPGVVLACSLISATWVDDRGNVANGAQDGVKVSLRVVGSSECVGQQVTFTIQEDDAVINDTNESLVGTFLGTTVEVPWTAAYIPDGVGNPEYTFFATTPDGSRRTSNELEVFRQQSSSGGGGGGGGKRKGNFISRLLPKADTLVSAPAVSLPLITKPLLVGMTDVDVLTLQKYLNANGFVIAATGPGSPGNETMYFGNLTQAAVQAFQRSKGIASSGTPDTTGYGRVGPKTMLAINALLGTISAPTVSAPASPQPLVCPAPHYGYKAGICLPSCGVLKGTASFVDACINHGMSDAGKAYDVIYCCKR